MKFSVFPYATEIFSITVLAPNGAVRHNDDNAYCHEYSVAELRSVFMHINIRRVNAHQPLTRDMTVRCCDLHGKRIRKHIYQILQTQLTVGRLLSD